MIDHSRWIYLHKQHCSDGTPEGCEVCWLIAEIERLQAELDRYKAAYATYMPVRTRKAADAAGMIMDKFVFPPLTCEQWTADAQCWSDALNAAGWAFIEEWRILFPGKPMPAAIFNNNKQLIRKAILTYAIEVAKASVLPK